MAAITLADKIKEFSVVRIKKALVRIPKLKARKKSTRIKKDSASSKKKDMPVSAIINILIKAAIEKSKKDKTGKNLIKGNNGYRVLKDDIISGSGDGYGSISKAYGFTLHSSYIDYGKLFSYLGRFRAKSPYENTNNSDVKLNADSSFSLIDSETMERGTRYIKYFAGGKDISPTLLVSPISGMSSAEWEQFKLWMQLDKVMYRLKTS